MENETSCVACFSKDFEPRFEEVSDYLYGAPGFWALHECKHCRTLQLQPIPSVDDIPKFYETYFTHNESATASGQDNSPIRSYIVRKVRAAYEDSGLFAIAGRTVIRFCAPRTAQALARSYGFMQPGNRPLDILDFGCGDGDLICRLSRIGHRTIGLDFDQKALAVCRSRGLDVYEASKLEHLESFRFDVVACMNVIEHVTDPDMLLQQLKRLLKPEGVLLIETPNAGSLLAHRLGAAWRGLETPRHLNIFSTQGLTSLLNRNGFSIERERFIPCADFMARSSDIDNNKKRQFRIVSPIIDLWEWLNPTDREVHFLEARSRK